MIRILSESDSVLNNFIYELRDKNIQTERMRFRKNMERVGRIIAYEISKTLNYKSNLVETPLGSAEVPIIEDQLVLLPILRAGIPLYNGFLDIFDNAESGFAGAYREEGEEINVNFGYLGAPDITGKVLILIDPMIATGKSQVTTLSHLQKHGKPQHIHIASVVSADEGLDLIEKELTDQAHTIWTIARDKELNDKKYIVPGLGDAGDLSFGPKL